MLCCQLPFIHWTVPETRLYVRPSSYSSKPEIWPLRKRKHEDTMFSPWDKNPRVCLGTWSQGKCWVPLIGLSTLSTLPPLALSPWRLRGMESLWLFAGRGPWGAPSGECRGKEWSGVAIPPVQLSTRSGCIPQHSSLKLISTISLNTSSLQASSLDVVMPRCPS